MRVLLSSFPFLDYYTYPSPSSAWAGYLNRTSVAGLQEPSKDTHFTAAVPSHPHPTPGHSSFITSPSPPSHQIPATSTSTPSPSPSPSPPNTTASSTPSLLRQYLIHPGSLVNFSLGSSFRPSAGAEDELWGSDRATIGSREHRTGGGGVSIMIDEDERDGEGGDAKGVAGILRRAWGWVIGDWCGGDRRDRL